jgi:hypothetical protein
MPIPSTWAKSTCPFGMRLKVHADYEHLGKINLPFRHTTEDACRL